MPSAGRLTVAEVRDYIQDVSAADNALDMDLSFSDEEIVSAMRRCAREYNSLPPYVGRVDPENLPDDTNIFLDGTAQHLYMSALAKHSRNDIDYTAGGVSTNLVAKRIAHLRQLSQEHGTRFREAATAYKVTLNLSHAFWSVS